MKRAGQIVLFNFPQADLTRGKLRPALILGNLPGQFDDSLVCMISSRTQRFVEGLDEIIRKEDNDFVRSGLKVASVIRVGRLAVVEGEMLVGAVGEIDPERLQRLKSNLANWLTDKEQAQKTEGADSTFVGLTGEATLRVTSERTAAHWQSGLVAGFATPAMIALMENAAFNATKTILPEGQTTVGVEVNIKHLAATPVGMNVRARAELVGVEGRKLFFKVEAWDDAEKIGEGTHTRVVVDLARFDKRMQEKMGLIQDNGSTRTF